ncbi:transporter substrate-binding domain-containing protein [Mesosutterella sp. AGMB02718]|uniref:Transporter substrate-binding domain-containing protein n=1 Tax=Mesosutterella faecium TaxID=2925194 RepID=A0ABT7IP27_9BURK|nr:transporter substrate-binding domain-containing protein [Mesosutterella sp. AGMB02718]MDL2059641.1 transporter substrate-binding domain-containing protein [Mesosutterella sp. AGMB02718]
MKLSTVMVALASLAVAGTAVAAPALTGTLKKAKDTGIFTIGYRDSSVPFSYLDADGKPIGYGMEICKRVAAEVGKAVGRKLTIKWQPITSGNRIPLLLNGTYDLECGSTTNSKERQKQVDFGTTYFRIGVTAAVKKNSSINSFKDLNGKNVSTTAGTTSVTLLRDLRKKGIVTRVTPAKDHAEAFQLLAQDRVVANVMDDILLAGQIANSKKPGDFRLLKESISEEPYGPMLRKDPQFKALVDKTITGMIKSGEMKKLYDTWFTKPIKPHNVNLNFPMNEPTKRAFASPNSEGI